MATSTAQTNPQGHDSAMDYPEHERSYSLFIGGLKWSVISIAAIVVVLFFVIQP